MPSSLISVAAAGLSTCHPSITTWTSTPRLRAASRVSVKSMPAAPEITKLAICIVDPGAARLTRLQICSTTPVGLPSAGLLKAAPIVTGAAGAVRQGAAAEAMAGAWALAAEPAAAASITAIRDAASALYVVVGMLFPLSVRELSGAVILGADLQGGASFTGTGMNPGNSR